MKAIKILLIVFVAIACIIPKDAVSKKQSKKSMFTYTLVDDLGESHTFEAPGIKFYTPSGNFLWTFKVKVPAEIMANIDFSPYANSIKEIQLTILSSGETLVADGYLNKAGNLHIELHKNGSGTIFPKGWF